MSTIRTTNARITMPYPGNASLCCPPCQVPRANLKVTNNIGPITTGDPNNRTVCYYNFANVPFGFPTNCNPPTACSDTNPCITVVTQYVKRLTIDEQTLIYNPTINMWGPTNWYYIQGVTQSGTGQSSNPGNRIGMPPLPNVDVSVSKGSFTFTRWSATCAGNNVSYGSSANGERFTEGQHLTLYQETVQLTGSATDDPTNLFNTWQNTPILIETIGTTVHNTVFMPEISLIPPFGQIITNCLPFMYQSLSKNIAGTIIGITLTQA